MAKFNYSTLRTSFYFNLEQMSLSISTFKRLYGFKSPFSLSENFYYIALFKFYYLSVSFYFNYANSITYSNNFSLYNILMLYLISRRDYSQENYNYYMPKLDGCCCCLF